MFSFKTAAKMKTVSKIGIGLSALFLSILLLMSYYGQKIGNFTIDVDEKTYEDKKLVLSSSIEFKDKSSRLIAEAADVNEPIGVYGKVESLPLQVTSQIDKFTDGSNNSPYYFAYCFYLKNDGGTPTDYDFTLTIEEVKRNVDSAIRIMIVRTSDIVNNPVTDQYVYAKVQGDNGDNPGEPELGTIPFVNEYTVSNITRNDLAPGTIDKYIVVMWLHGEDKDCVNYGDYSISSGIIKLAMKFTAIK